MGNDKIVTRQSRIDQLIEHVEAAFKEGLPYAYVEVGRYKGYSTGTVRALSSRGYRIERRVLGSAYHIYPKPVVPAVAKTYFMPLTESEIISIREAVRNFPRNLKIAKEYEPEFFSVDKKMTAKLADIFDEREGLKKT
jgi:hypothetical protein